MEETKEKKSSLPPIPGNFSLKGISQISFNKDLSQCAICKNKNEIYICKIGNINDVTTWKIIKTLDEGHSQFVSGLDWNHITNRIFSCSYDKTAIIWYYKNDDWIPNHLVASTKLGYLFGSWNIRGDKLVCGTSEKKLFIGYLNEKSGWWSSQNIKVHKSSVLCAKIDPTSLFVISGSTDLKIYVTSCYIPEVDDSSLTKETKPFAQPFGTPVFKFDCCSWVNCVAWSPTPKSSYAFTASQNSNLVITDYRKNSVEEIKLNHAPIQFILPKSDTEIYCIGYDKEIYLYGKEGDQWLLKKKITQLPENVKANTLPNFNGQEDKPSFIMEGPKMKHLHYADISSATLKDNNIITTDLIGFVKFWKI